MKRGYLFLLLAFFLTVIPVIHAQEVPRDFCWEIAKENIPGHEWTGISAHSEVVDTNEYVIWCADRAYIFPAVATLMNVSSSDVDDTAGGNGLWNVTLYGLDTDRNPIIEVVQLNGQTPVITTNEFLRVNRMVGIQAGSTGTNEGDVFIGVGATAAGEPDIIYHVICADEGWSHVGVYSVKAGYTAFLVRGIFGTDDDKQVTFGVYQRSTTNPDNAWQMVIHLHVDQQYVYASDFYQPLPPAADILVKSSVTVADASVVNKISILLINTTVLHNASLPWEDGTPSEIVINEPVNIIIESSEVDLLSQIPIIWMFFASLATITLATPKLIGNKSLRMMSYPIGVVLWVCAAYIWAIEYAGTNFFPIVYVHLIPILIQTAWGFVDAGESLAEESSKKTKYFSDRP